MNVLEIMLSIYLSVYLFVCLKMQTSVWSCSTWYFSKCSHSQQFPVFLLGHRDTKLWREENIYNIFQHDRFMLSPRALFILESAKMQELADNSVSTQTSQVEDRAERGSS